MVGCSAACAALLVHVPDALGFQLGIHSLTTTGPSNLPPFAR